MLGLQMTSNHDNGGESSGAPALNVEPQGYPGIVVDVGASPHDAAAVDQIHPKAMAYFDQVLKFDYDDERHTPALQHIADTDSWPENGPEWDDELRLAVQHRLLTAFRAYPHPDLVKPELHPAAPLIPLLLHRHQQLQQQHHQQQQQQEQQQLMQQLDQQAQLQFQQQQLQLLQQQQQAEYVNAHAAYKVSNADMSSFYPSRRAIHHFHVLQQQLQHQQHSQQSSQQADTSISTSEPAAQGSVAPSASSSANPAPDATSETSKSNGGTGAPGAPAAPEVASTSAQASSSDESTAVASSTTNAEDDSLASQLIKAWPTKAGPPLHAPQIPLKHAEVMLYELLNSSFSVEPYGAVWELPELPQSQGEGKEKQKSEGGKGSGEADGQAQVDGSHSEKAKGVDAEGNVEMADADGARPDDKEVKEEDGKPGSAEANEAGTGEPDASGDVKMKPASGIPPSASTNELPNDSLIPIFNAHSPLFAKSPPFTLQRLAELAVDPTVHHSSSTKFLHALERVLRVTATWADVQDRVAAVEAEEAEAIANGEVQTEIPPVRADAAMAIDGAEFRPNGSPAGASALALQPAPAPSPTLTPKPNPEPAVAAPAEDGVTLTGQAVPSLALPWNTKGP